MNDTAWICLRIHPQTMKVVGAGCFSEQSPTRMLNEPIYVSILSVSRPNYDAARRHAIEIYNLRWSEFATRFPIWDAP